MLTRSQLDEAKGTPSSAKHRDSIHWIRIWIPSSSKLRSWNSSYKLPFGLGHTSHHTPSMSSLNMQLWTYAARGRRTILCLGTSSSHSRVCGRTSKVPCHWQSHLHLKDDVLLCLPARLASHVSATKQKSRNKSLLIFLQQLIANEIKTRVRNSRQRWMCQEGFLWFPTWISHLCVG